MNKLFLVFALVFILTSIVSATNKDVVYVVQNQYYVRPNVVSIINELGLSYQVIYSVNVSSTNFSNYKMMIIGDGYFNNPQQVPVNNVSSVILNGENMPNWGWCKYITKSSQTTPFHIDITVNHELTNGLSLGEIVAYSSTDPDLYVLSSTNIYSGIKIVSSKISAPSDGVIAYAEAGDVLTRPGYPNTHVNAKTVFFGITETDYWTNETKELFKNAVSWTVEKERFDLELTEGINLISFPLISNQDFSSLISTYPEIGYIKEYNNGFSDANLLINSRGYFIKTNSPFILNFQGEKPLGNQTFQLKQGMNLIGLTSLKTMSLTSLPPQIIEVAERKSDGSYDTATKYGFGWYNPKNISLKPGKGYWFKLSSQINWSYVS